jgi:hypothetical protein
MTANRTSNVRWGVTRGLFVAVLYCLWVSAVYVIRGTDPFDRQGILELTRFRGRLTRPNFWAEVAYEIEKDRTTCELPPV